MSDLILNLVKSTAPKRSTVVWNATERTVNGNSCRTVPASVVDTITKHGVVTEFGTVAKFTKRTVTGRKPKGAAEAPMVSAKLIDLGGGVAVGWRERKPGAAEWVPVVVTEELTAADFGF